MAGDKAFQTQDKAHQVQDCCTVVDDYLDCGYFIGCFIVRIEREDNRLIINLLSLQLHPYFSSSILYSLMEKSI